MLVRGSIRGKAYAAKARVPSQVEKRYVTVCKNTVKRDDSRQRSLSFGTGYQRGFRADTG
jgi:hypothetical protein